MADEKRSPANDSSLEDTRREQFVQELLDSGRKSGEYLDARTARLLEVPRGTPMLRMAGCTRRTDGSILHTCHQVGYGEDFDFILR